MNEQQFAQPEGEGSLPRVLAEAYEVAAKLPPLPDAPVAKKASLDPEVRLRGWPIQCNDEIDPRDRFCVVMGGMLFELLEDLPFNHVDDLAIDELDRLAERLAAQAR